MIFPPASSNTSNVNVVVCSSRHAHDAAVIVDRGDLRRRLEGDLVLGVERRELLVRKLRQRPVGGGRGGGVLMSCMAVVVRP